MDFLHKLFTRLKRGTLSYKSYIKPNALIVLLAVTVTGLNITMFNGGKIYTDESFAAKLITDNPELNPRLAAKLSSIKLASQTSTEQTTETTSNGNIFLKTAQAANLEDNDLGDKKPFEYEVQGGDTLSNIAERYSLKLNTILWANDLSAKSIIRPGQKITLLPVDGVLYTIKKGDTIGKVAVLHNSDSRKIMEYNDIEDPTKIHAGDAIIIPDGQPLPEAKPKPVPSKPDNDNIAGNAPPSSTEVPVTGKLLWPTTTRNITQKYSASHRGIDISNGAKPPVYASHSGTVEFAGTSGDWGKTILVRGDDGLVTRYSHNSENYVKTGDRVEAGDTIAKVGNTGRVRGATGLHLDFRVYKNGVAVNPFNLFD